MSAFPINSKLPELSSAVSEKSVVLPSSPDWTQKLYKTRPAYVAKKVSNDELFGDPFRPTNLGLSQINEEKVHETEELDLLCGPDAYESDEPRNVFQADALVSSKYKEHGRGPMFKPDGNIVKHSIVGPIEMFERCQRGAKKGAPPKDSGLSSEKDTVSFSERSMSRTFKPLGSSHMNDMSTSTLTRLGTQSSVLFSKKQATTGDKKKDAKNLKVNKQELYSKIDQLRQDQMNFYKKEIQKVKKLPIADQLHHTKEERCLHKFDGVMNNWTDNIITLNKQTQRKAGKSVMLSSDSFRSKVEEAETFGLLQTEQERFGTTFWYMTLRKYGNHHDFDGQRVINDIPEGFHSPQIIRPPSSIEVVKRPTQLSKTSTLLPSLSPSLSETRLLDRTKNEYIFDKTTQFNSELKKILPNPNLDVNNFMIEGRNKLELEVTAFFKANPRKETFVVPKQLFNRSAVVENESECLVSHYDTKEITKNGLAAFLR